MKAQRCYLSLAAYEYSTRILRLPLAALRDVDLRFTRIIP